MALVLTVSAPHLEASPTLTYTLRDLGAFPDSNGVHQDPTFGSDSGGGLLLAPDGSAYRFNPSSFTSASRDGLPLGPQHGSVQWGESSLVNYVSGAYQNLTGFTVYVTQSGNIGHSNGGSTLFAGQRPTDGAGSAGDDPYAQVDSSYSNISSTGQAPGSSSSTVPFRLAGINKLDQVLYDVNRSSYPSVGTYLYDSESGMRIDLMKLLEGQAAASGATLRALALDDEGRILLATSKLEFRAFGDRYGGELVDQGRMYMLTPSDMSADAVPVPEPSPVAFAAIASLGLAIRGAARARSRARCRAR
jgi:hypothetical protein